MPTDPADPSALPAPDATPRPADAAPGPADAVPGPSPDPAAPADPAQRGDDSAPGGGTDATPRGIVGEQGGEGAPASAGPAVRVERPVPDESELERIAEPAQVRRAPKFSAFLVVGGLVGALVALLLALLIRPEFPPPADGTGFTWFLDGQNAVRTVSLVTGAVVGTLVGGALAVLADRRSTRRR